MSQREPGSRTCQSQSRKSAVAQPQIMCVSYLKFSGWCWHTHDDVPIICRQISSGQCLTHEARSRTCEVCVFTADSETVISPSVWLCKTSEGGVDLPVSQILMGKFTRVSSVKLLSGMREQKRFDSDLKVVTEECVHCFISTRTVTPVYSNLALHPCSLVANFKESFEKQPPPSQRVTLQESPAHDATLLWISSQALLNFLTRRPD